MGDFNNTLKVNSTSRAWIYLKLLIFLLRHYYYITKWTMIFFFLYYFLFIQKALYQKMDNDKKILYYYLFIQLIFKICVWISNSKNQFIYLFILSCCINYIEQFSLVRSKIRCMITFLKKIRCMIIMFEECNNLKVFRCIV